MSNDSDAFRLADDFHAQAPSGGLGLGALEAEYEALFSEVLADGVITREERERLERAAKNLGIERGRMERLEQAMSLAYETHHQVRIVRSDEDDSPRPSLRLPGTEQDPRAEVAALRAENEALRHRISELERDLRRAEEHVAVEIDLGSLTSSPVEMGGALASEVWKEVRRDPYRANYLRALRDAYLAESERDGAYLASQALLGMGAADERDTALLAERPRGDLILPRTSIDESTWSDCLFHPEEDRVTGAIFSVIAPAVLVLRVTTLRRDGKLRLPVPSKRQDPEKTTVMAARAVAWGATLLGLPCPTVYVDPEADVGYESVCAVPPYSLLGQKVLRGRTASELAFLLGRHLSAYRGEHFVRSLFPATEDLEDLFLSALLLAQPALPLGDRVRLRVAPLAQAIGPLLEPTHLDHLRGLYARFADEGGRTNLQRFGGGLVKTAHRVGLALSQDLPRALELIEQEEGPRGPLAQELISFFTSERMILLRRRLGLSLT